MNFKTGSRNESLKKNKLFTAGRLSSTKLHRSTFMETFFELFLYCLHWLIAGGLRYEQWTTIKEYARKLFQRFVTSTMSYSHS